MPITRLFQPPTGFHFVLRMELPITEFPGIPDIGFTDVSGLDITVGVEEFKEGGENRFAHKLPSSVSYSNLTLKRGLLVGSQAWDWFKTSLDEFKFSPKDINLILLNGDHLPIQAWNFKSAYPVKWSISKFNSISNEVAIESFEIAYESFTRTI